MLLAVQTNSAMNIVPSQRQQLAQEEQKAESLLIGTETKGNEVTLMTPLRPYVPGNRGPRFAKKTQKQLLSSMEDSGPSKRRLNRTQRQNSVRLQTSSCGESPVRERAIGLGCSRNIEIIDCTQSPSAVSMQPSGLTDTMERKSCCWTISSGTSAVLENCSCGWTVTNSGSLLRETTSLRDGNSSSSLLTLIPKAGSGTQFHLKISLPCVDDCTMCCVATLLETRVQAWEAELQETLRVLDFWCPTRLERKRKNLEEMPGLTLSPRSQSLTSADHPVPSMVLKQPVDPRIEEMYSSRVKLRKEHYKNRGKEFRLPPAKVEGDTLVPMGSLSSYTRRRLLDSEYVGTQEQNQAIFETISLEEDVKNAVDEFVSERYKGIKVDVIVE